MNPVFADIERIDPRDGGTLTFVEASAPGDGVWRAADGQCWPQIDAVSFLRAGREALAGEAVDLLGAGRRTEALGLLFTDTDDFAPSAPSRAAATGVAADVIAGRCSPIAAMRRLDYGPVADYFAIRPSTPTFLSGLELLATTLGETDRVIEIACGIGHFLDHLYRHGVACAGSDVTFSKLWLGRRFLLPAEVPLICADLIAGAAFPVTVSSSASVLCHDAFYFFPDKPRAARRLETLAGDEGRLLLGHVHLKDYDHGGIAGDLLSAPEYKALLRAPQRAYADHALAAALLAACPAEAVEDQALAGVEAMAIVAGRAPDPRPLIQLRDAPAQELLYWNPLLGTDAAAALTPAWPSPAFAREYAGADYLRGLAAPAVTAFARRGADMAAEWRRRRAALPASNLRIGVEPVRWAVIGCGWVARDFVVPAFAHAPSACLSALCDLDAARRRQCGRAAHSDPAEYSDYAALLDAADVDAVYIATPNDSHAAIASTAAAAGRHVFCEKPIATRPADAARMIRACEQANVRYATAFDQRFHEAHHVLRTAVADGALGYVTQVRIHYACQVDAQWSASPTDADNWRLDRHRAGGGAVIDLAPHALDLLAFVLDQEPVELGLMLQPRLGASATEDVDAGGVLSVRTAGGVLASIHVSYQCPEYLPRREIELVGSRGGARATNTMGQTPGGAIEWRGPRATRVERFDEAAELSPFARQIEAFSAALIAQREWPFAPERDRRHFALLYEALERAERDIDAHRGALAASN